MRKEITIGAAQLGPIARSDSRKVVVERLIELMRKAKKSGCDIVVYPELALTSFFPRWYMEKQEDVDSFLSTKCRARQLNRCSNLRLKARSASI